MTLECPQCKSPVAREGQRFCYRCGHELRAYYDSLNITLKDVPAEANDTLSQDALQTLQQQAAVTSTVNPAALTNDLEEEDATDTITEATLPASEPARQKAFLKILLPTGDVFDRDLIQSETQIGKGPRNDIVISDPAVSAAHATIRYDDGHYTVTDLGSRNGTFINGERISETHRLNHGDVIGVGLSRLTFRLSNYSETGAIQSTDLIAAAEKVAPLPLTEESLASAALAEGLVAKSDIDRLTSADRAGRRLYRALVWEKLASEESLRDLMSRVFQIPIVDLRTTPIDEDTAIGFSSRIARDHHVFAFAKESDSLFLAVADPTDTDVADKVKQEFGLATTTRLATWSEIGEQIEKFYGPKLIGVLPTGEKLRFLIDQAEIEIGKASHNHIVLTDPTVSNTHAIILAREGGFSIVDLGSRNGTFVNGEKLGAHARTLRHGDSIQLGQTVLTFRNSGETPENQTAMLSLDAMEEIRRRAAEASAREKDAPAFAAASPASPADVTPGVVAPPAVVVPVEATPQSVEPATVNGEGDKKKKKKKKGQDERLKAAYISGLSRIVAQVLGVVLAVLLALYVNSSMRSGSDKPVIETSTKGKAKVKIATPGAGTPFDAGKDAAGNPVAIEASGAAQPPGAEGVYIVDDSKPGEVLWMQLDQSGKQVGQLKPIEIGASVADPEGITYGGSFFYVVGSQSHAEPGDRNALVRFAVDVENHTLQGKAEVMADLRAFLLANVPELKGAGDKATGQGGLDVEGIAWDTANDRLLLGLRSPLLNGSALVVPLKLRDPRGPFSAENLTAPGPTIQLALGGLGIRDIQFDKRSNSFLIITGSAAHGESPASSLWEWNGDPNQSNAESQPREVTKLDAKMKPEGVTQVKIGGRDFIFIVGDGSSYMKLDYSEAP